MGQSQIYTSSALETFSLVTGPTSLAPIKSGLSGLVYENTSASTAWVQVFDGFAQPSNGTVPILSLKVPPTTQGSAELDGVGKLIGLTGLVVTLSSTGPTYTPITNSLFLTAFWIKGI